MVSLHSLPALRVILGASAAVMLAASLAAQQEGKPIPKDSVRVLVRGCTKGYVFTAGARSAEEPGTLDIREGMHLRMNGPKKMMAEIKAHEGSRVQIIGLMKKGQFIEGVNVGHGVTISPGYGGGPGAPAPTAGLPQIDLESWQPVDGGCKTK